MIVKAKEFAERKAATTYVRLKEQEKELIERLTAGKLGELIGVRALEKVGIPYSAPSMLSIVESKSYGDAADCFIYPDTTNVKSVDFKTAWKPYHKMLLVPEDMIVNSPKDIYIGIKLKADNQVGTVYGYVSREELKKRAILDWGEGKAFSFPLEDLHPLESLKIKTSQYEEVFEKVRGEGLLITEYQLIKADSIEVKGEWAILKNVVELGLSQGSKITYIHKQDRLGVRVKDLKFHATQLKSLKDI
jgi:hypothetical protein